MVLWARYDTDASAEGEDVDGEGEDEGGSYGAARRTRPEPPRRRPVTEQVALGPLINATQLANVDRIVTETVTASAEVRAGAKHRDLFYEPIVLAGVTSSMPAFREEIFGPVAPVIVVKDEAEAISVANDTEYGLVPAIQTGSLERGRAVADRLTTGIVHVNDQTLNNDAYAPFGGTGASGNGARFGS